MATTCVCIQTLKGNGYIAKVFKPSGNKSSMINSVLVQPNKPIVCDNFIEVEHNNSATVVFSGWVRSYMGKVILETVYGLGDYSAKPINKAPLEFYDNKLKPGVVIRQGLQKGCEYVIGEHLVEVYSDDRPLMFVVCSLHGEIYDERWRSDNSLKGVLEKIDPKHLCESIEPIMLNGVYFKRYFLATSELYVSPKKPIVPLLKWKVGEETVTLRSDGHYDCTCDEGICPHYPKVQIIETIRHRLAQLEKQEAKNPLTKRMKLFEF